MFLRQSTSQAIRFGPCLDKGDGVAEEEGLTLAQADMRLSKDGGAYAQKSAAGNATHDSDGHYSTTLSTTDTDTVGELRLNVHQPANMLPVWDRWWVLEEAVYDAIYGASAAGPLQSATAGRTLIVDANGLADANMVKAGPTGSGTAQTTGDIPALVVTADAVIDVVASVVGALNDAAAAGEVTTTDTLMQYLKQLINILIGTPGIGAFPAEAAPGNAVSLAEVIRAIHSDVTGLNGAAMVGTNGANTTAPDNAGIAANQVDLNTVISRLPGTLVNGRMDSTVDGTGMEAGAAQVVADLIMPKKNTDLANVEFLMVDATDGFTPETGLTITVTRSIDGGAFGAKNGSTTVTEVANGIYQLDINAADLNGAIITFRMVAAGAADRFLTIRTSG